MCNRLCRISADPQLCSQGSSTAALGLKVLPERNAAVVPKACYLLWLLLEQYLFSFDYFCLVFRLFVLFLNQTAKQNASPRQLSSAQDRDMGAKTPQKLLL